MSFQNDSEDIIISTRNFIPGLQSPKKKSSGSATTSSRISVVSMNRILDRLKGMQNRDSMVKMYLSVWHQFNAFLIKLDAIPWDWEDRTSLFIAHLIHDKKAQSATIKSYVSAIKKMVVMDGYKWMDNKILVSALTKACRLINDSVKIRLPIQCGFLEMILFEIERISATQPYLERLYEALFALGYYGLMRIGELTASNHCVKAKNIHLALNKEKLLIVLYSSKTHNKGHVSKKSR